MAFDFKKIFNLDSSYPGFSFGYESWALGMYLQVLDEHLPFAQDQYRLRSKRELEKQSQELLPEEMAQEASEIDEAAETQIPRFFRIGALIPIWGLFESFVSDIVGYTGRKEGVGLSLRDIRAPNLRKQVEKYFEGVLRINLPWSEDERARLGYLQELRNLIAHRNGRITDMTAEKRQEVERLVSAVSGVEIDNGLLIVSSEYIQEAAALVFDTVAKLNNLVAERYDGPVVPHSET